MKWFCLVLSVIVLGCGSISQQGFMAENGKLKVLSTTAMIDDLVGAIGGEDIDHLSLIVGDLDPHSYELVKGDDEKFFRADLIFCNGLGLEHGASLHEILHKDEKAISLGDHLYKEDPQSFLVVDHQLDPHFWMDIALFSRAIDPIVRALSAKDPSHAMRYQERGEKLRKKMLETEESLIGVMEQIPSEKRYLVSSHDAFNYFSRKYLALAEEKEEKRFMAPEGLAPDGQMSLHDIEEAVHFLCTHQVHVVFPETNINQNALKKIVFICRKKGLHVRIAEVPLYGDTMGTREDGAGTYLEMIEHNVHTLSKELVKE